LVAKGATAWHLNVKADNVAAIRLYERLGFRRRYESSAMRIDWARVERLPATALEAAVIAPDNDAGVEQAMGFVPGTLATARAKGEAVLLELRTDSGAVCGAAVFDPGFPGAFPFRVLEPSLAPALLRAM